MPPSHNTWLTCGVIWFILASEGYEIHSTTFVVMFARDLELKFAGIVFGVFCTVPIELWMCCECVFLFVESGSIDVFVFVCSCVRIFVCSIGGMCSHLDELLWACSIYNRKTEKIYIKY